MFKLKHKTLQNIDILSAKILSFLAHVIFLFHRQQTDSTAVHKAAHVCELDFDMNGKE